MNLNVIITGTHGIIKRPFFLWLLLEDRSPVPFSGIFRKPGPSSGWMMRRVTIWLCRSRTRRALRTLRSAVVSASDGHSPHPSQRPCFVWEDDRREVAFRDKLWFDFRLRDRKRFLGSSSATRKTWRRDRRTQQRTLMSLFRCVAASQCTAVSRDGLFRLWLNYAVLPATSVQQHLAGVVFLIPQILKEDQIAQHITSETN